MTRTFTSVGRGLRHIYDQVIVVEDVAELGRGTADEQILPWCVDHNAVWATKDWHRRRNPEQARRLYTPRSVLAKARGWADEVAWGCGHVLVAAAGEGHGAVPLSGGVAAAFAAVDSFQQWRAQRPAITADAHRTRGISHTWWRILTTIGAFQDYKFEITRQNGTRFQITA